MIDRDLVYACVSREAEALEEAYKNRCATGFEDFVPLFNWRSESFIIRIVDEMTRLQGIRVKAKQLECFLTIAGWAVLAMENCGTCGRNVNTGHPTDFVEPRLTWGQICAIINTERQYQEELSPDRTDGHERGTDGYSVMLSYYVHKLVEQWTVNAGDEYALDVMRKVAGICVHCLEDCGVSNV